MKKSAPEGWHGWDEYAAFYDWENARTFGKRDVAFWRRLLADIPSPCLELGCGTGRLLLPLGRAGVRLVGVDRSAPMLDRAATRLRQLSRARRPVLVRADVRALPFPSRSFGAVIAAYGLAQSLLDDDDLKALFSEIARVLEPGGTVGLDLVPDLRSWKEYRGQVTLRGRARGGATVTLVETVRQDRRRALTTFHEVFTERRGNRTRRHRFSLRFRTLTADALAARLSRAGLDIESAHGDYRGGPITPGSDTWLILARKKC